MMRSRVLVCVCTVVLIFAPVNSAGAAGDAYGENGAAPRFGSLRANEVNLRTGPGTRYPIEWRFVREGMPVEVLRAYDTWREVRDVEGTVGWVHQSMLSGRRTLIVTGEPRTLRSKPADQAPAVAIAEPGVIGELVACAAGSRWCRVRLDGFEGWLKREEFWGSYAEEAIR